MTAAQFNEFWILNYAETSPLQHNFRNIYPDRWFRIHSLPESKRYAQGKEEWDILLYRQNVIMSDLLGENADLILVTGEYGFNSPDGPHIVLEKSIFASYSFIKLSKIDLCKIDRDAIEGQTFTPAFSEITWKINKHNPLLIEIANDEVRCFFVSPAKKIIVAPYDGGVDIVLNDTETRDIYKMKYKHWLSDREDGL